MKLSLTIDRYKYIPLPLILAVYRARAVSGIEATIEIFQNPGLAARIAGSMRLGLHLPYWGKYGYDLAYTPGKKLIDPLIHTIRQNQTRLSFDYAVFHPPEGPRRESSYDYLAGNLRQLPMPLLLENSLGHNLDSFVSEAETIEQKLGCCLAGFCIDIPHAFLAGDAWQDFMTRFGSRVKLVHLSDCDGRQDSHLPFPFAGGLDLEDILDSLKRMNYQGRLNFELKPPSFWRAASLFGNLKKAEEVVSKNI